MQKYGYIRVSSADQNIARQSVEMEKLGIDRKRIYVDKQSGKDFERENYQKLLKKLKANDELYIDSVDRLGRNYDEIIENWQYLTRVKKVDMVVLDFPLLDTRAHIIDNGNLGGAVTGKFIADLVLQILSYTAHLEREHIHHRQAEGIKVAMEKGVRFGRPCKEKPQTFHTVYIAFKTGKISLRKACKECGVSHQTFKKWVYEEEEGIES